MNRKIYEEREIEKQPLERKIMVHGAMNYECEVCGKGFLMWLEKGLEDRVSDMTGGEHKPVPFTIPCLCGGVASHVRWNEDIRLDGYAELQENMSYFGNEEDYDCGVSHIRTNGEKCYIASQRLEELTKLKNVLRNKHERKKELRDDTDEEDDPYGLAHISTSKLKAELRRRKRW